ncbi:MAG: site-2 protease family protein [Thermodesulfobacteriota bacterium]
MTAITTTIAGALQADKSGDDWLSYFLSGWVFSVPLLSILLVHEMGHYIAARLNRLDVTPPFFLPGPPPVGTFGAFIKIRSMITNRRALMQVGASGPVAGAILAIPLLMVGLFLSEVSHEPPKGESLAFGTSLILELLSLVRFGEYTSNVNIILHPTAVAAWFGLFVTAMNLLPIGQLDGGHVIYALVGPRKATLFSYGFFGILIPLGVFVWPGWLVFGALVFFLGLRHPAPLDPITPLSRGARLLGWTALVLFILTFVPVPISITP